MVWSCMASEGVRKLCTVSRTINSDVLVDILEYYMIPSTEEAFGDSSDFLFQDDNASCHRRKQVKDFLNQNGWMVRFRLKANAQLWDLGLQGACSLRGGLSMGSQPVFTRVSEKNTKSSERQGRQVRPGFEPGTSRLPVLSVTTPLLVKLLNQNGNSPIKTMNRPANIPDPYPIENVWNVWKTNIERRRPTNMDELHLAIRRVGRKFHRLYVKSLLNPCPAF